MDESNTTPTPNPTPDAQGQSNQTPRPSRPPRPGYRNPAAPQTPKQMMPKGTAGNPARPLSEGPAPTDGTPKADGQNRGQGGGRDNRGGSRNGGRSGDRRRRQMGPTHTDLLPALDNVPVNKSLFNGFDGLQQSKGKGAAKPQPGQNRGPANQVSTQKKLKVMPLGGLGEIAKNMMAIEYDDDIVIVDMGFGFPDANQPGVDYIIPDVTYLEANRHKVKGIVITHGHMDHIGASGYMIPKFPVPIYGSRLSLAFVAKQIEEFKIQQPKWMVMDPDKHERVQIGNSFNIELVRVTHTISDATAVIIRTPVGTIINTGDWRADPTPLDGKHMDFARLEEIGKEGVLLLMSDSTSCDYSGHKPTEQVVEPTLKDLFGRAQGRIIISTFSSSITRVQLIIDITAASGRKLALVGRSMLGNIELCVKLGYLKVPQGLLIKVQEAGNLPGNEVVIMCTGSQGEENSALVRMSTGDHPHVKIKPGDTVIFSSSVIPGNEVSVVTLLDNLMREGANVFSGSTASIKDHGPVHVGGHANREDVGDLVELIKPKFYMPIHGEFHHLVYNAEVAVERGVPRANVFVMDNGDCLELTPDTGVKGARIPAGMVMVDGIGVGDVEGIVLRDRLAIGGDGVFMIVATVGRKSGRLIGSPDIISRGFIYMKDHEELVGTARSEIRKTFERRAVTGNTSREDWNKFKLKLRDEVGDLLYAKTGRSPMILPVINEV